MTRPSRLLTAADSPANNPQPQQPTTTQRHTVKSGKPSISYVGNTYINYPNAPTTLQSELAQASDPPAKMTSVFASLVRSSKPRSDADMPTAVESLAALPARAPNPEHDDVDLRDLNSSLQCLTEMFPDVQPEVFREMLAKLSSESRVEIVTEQLLRRREKFVRGRYRMPAEQEEQRDVAHRYKYRTVDYGRDTRGVPLAREDKFRSNGYKDAAKDALYSEFKGLSHSTIKAVLAEYNWSYTHARPTLLALSSQSWRSSITNFIMRRKAPSADHHPLVMWLAPDARTGHGRKPLLVKTKSPELDQELYETLIVPELEKQRKEQMQHDLELALKLNEEEAESEGEMYDCECCFIPNTLQQMSACSVEGHYVCFRCIRHSINAALYDQGWSRNIDTGHCTLKCIAPMADGVDDCGGCIPFGFVKRALLEEPDGEDALSKLDEHFTHEALLKSRLPLVRCPFCSYAEVDDPALPPTRLLSAFRIKKQPLLLASFPLLQLLTSPFVRLLFLCFMLPIILAIVLSAVLPKPFPLFTPFLNALRSMHLKRRGLRFQCLSPTCRRASCLSCSAPWHDPHTCFSSALTSLRLTLERATTDAIKRTCPACNLSFVKADGCNKLVCVCGYSMCYICRQGLAREGYKHFCQHFRERPGEKCAECQRCDLYRVEDEDVVVARAKEKAEKEWWEAQGEDATKGLKERAGRQMVVGESKGRWHFHWGDLEVWIEKALETVLE